MGLIDRWIINGLNYLIVGQIDYYCPNYMMDEWRKGWVDVGRDGWTDGWMDYEWTKYLDGWMVGLIDRLITN